MKWLLRPTPILAILWLVAATLADAQVAKQDEKAPPLVPNYYPLEVGNQWTVTVQAGDITSSATLRIAKIETVDGVPLARLEATRNGNLVATEHLVQRKEGVFRYRINDQEVAPPICLLKYPVVAGGKWDGDMTVGKDKGKYSCVVEEDAVEVPAGKFQALRVTLKLESKGLKYDVTSWFVKDIGIVKVSLASGDFKSLSELEKFEVKKLLPK